MQNDLPLRRLRIAIFTADDVVWDLAIWKKAIPMLLEEHDVVGLHIFPDRLVKLKGIEIQLWYLKVFGIWSFFLLGLLAVKQRIKILFSSIRNWWQLAQIHGLYLNFSTSPNNQEVVNWLNENKIDIIIITVGNIIKEIVIKSVKVGIINKHASMLPSCRGLYPYFWAKLNGVQTGVSFHQVDTGIDTGKILVQLKHPSQESNISMLRFYIDIFAMYPKLVKLAVRRLAESQYTVALPELASSYYSLPTREDYLNFRNKGFQVCKFSDLFYRPPGNQEINSL